MPDLSTTYMGLKLKNPLVAAASPLTEHLANFRKLEDSGVSAIVKHSLFEEQIEGEEKELDFHLTHGTNAFAESLSFFPNPTTEFIVGPEVYLKQIEKAKSQVDIPIIGSLNGYSEGGWTKYAKMIEEAGADALELNIYFIPTNPDMDGVAVEEHYLRIIKAVKESVSIPVSVKLSPFFSSLANFARKLDDMEIDALVLFNRFYQPDVDLENLEVNPNIILSTPHAIRLPLRWMAILYGNVKASLGATSGIHSSDDVLKMLMVGADVTMLCSSILKNGIKHSAQILKNIDAWMEEKEYESVEQLKGSMSQKSCANPGAFERAQYTKALQSYQIY